MDSEVSHQPKQERSRTRWTASLDKIFADLVVKQIQLGNRPNNIFDKKTWNSIRDEFNKQTDLNFNNNQLRKHLDVLRARFNNLKSSFDQNDFAIDDSCCIGFDLWEDIAAQTRPETIRTKDCPIYEQLCTIFTESSPDGKYAQSSHYEGLDRSVGTNTAVLTSCPEGVTPRSENPSSSKFVQGNVSLAATPHSENPSSSKFVQGNVSLAEKVIKNIVERKRKRPSETRSSACESTMDQEMNDAMAEALLEMVAASKLRAVAMTQIDVRFSITNCIKALDEIESIDQRLYLAALDLFEDPNLRETFISLKGSKIRLTWLQGKCGNAISS